MLENELETQFDPEGDRIVDLRGYQPLVEFMPEGETQSFEYVTDLPEGVEPVWRTVLPDQIDESWQTSCRTNCTFPTFASSIRLLRTFNISGRLSTSMSLPNNAVFEAISRPVPTPNSTAVPRFGATTSRVRRKDFQRWARRFPVPRPSPNRWS